MGAAGADEAAAEARILAIERPDPALLTEYLLRAALTLVAFPVVAWLLYVRYRTLRYRFDADGVGASWGLLFRREIHLTYRRIQDIHVRRNLFERWLGLGTVELQTASGAASAELALEGMRDHEAVRDFLYRRMRGNEPDPPAAGPAAPEGDEVALLRAIRDELAAARRALEERRA